jgi:flagellar basal body-associated protein FliL
VGRAWPVARLLPSGKAALKKGIQERATEVLKEQKVFDVLFAEFVVQF